MKKLIFVTLLATILVVNPTSGQTPCWSRLDYTSGTTDEIVDVFAVEYRANGEFTVVASANEDYYHNDDTTLVVFKIKPNGDIIDDTIINFDISSTPKYFIAKDIIETSDGRYIVCGSVKYPDSPGGTSGFIVIMDTNQFDTPQLWIYDSTLCLNAVIYDDDDQIIAVGQSYRDHYAPYTWDSLPCVLVLDGSDPTSLLDSYVVRDWGPETDIGYFNDIEQIAADQFILTGRFKVVEDEDMNMSYDILLSSIDVDNGGTIGARENIVIRSGSDLSDETGNKLYVAGPNEMFVTGESWDPPTQMSPEKDIHLTRITGNIKTGSLTSLTYEFFELDLDNPTNPIFATDIDYHQPYDALTISGYFIDDVGLHPYILQRDMNYYYYYANDHTYDNGEHIMNSTLHILHSSERVLSFGWTDWDGEMNVTVMGDSLFYQPSPMCPEALTVNQTDPAVFKKQIINSSHDEAITHYEDPYIANPTIGLHDECQYTTPVFKSQDVSGLTSTGTCITKMGSVLQVSDYYGEYRIFNTLGQEIMKGYVTEGEIINISGLDMGAYIINLPESNYSYKFIK